ncbi:polysaccharide biosynthesis tyrosine autokinase [Actibacterium sp. 188UL27-1]|uniref:GumC family protein n=1 Tax=Actibacterium sp. 188UL27-1 TaxID=2786961 RepID=UPI00195E4633|nr:polysaccharide biosynthesis tyrosine autokinase [Actibacterium sp. 188UL27-1]MBM7069076.1 polysaccharide biosynthesis tyrosine autokinase [Actibacterium sp. 188UL27-1]
MNEPLVLRSTIQETDPAKKQAVTLDLNDIVGVLRRRLILILATTILAAAYAAYVVLQITPQYEARSQLALGDGGLASPDTSFSLVEAQAISSSVIEGEMAVMRSRALLVRVVRRLELDKDPEFNPALRPQEDPGVLDVITDMARSVVRTVIPVPEAPQRIDDAGVEDGSEGQDPVLEAARARDNLLGDLGPVTGELRDAIRVRQQGNSFVISLTATSQSPQKAAAIANTLTDEYSRFLVDKRFAAAQRFTRWLEGRVEELATTLESSEREALAFRAKIEANADSSLRLEQQMRELTTKLVNARSELAEADANANKLVEIRDRDGALAAAATLSEPTILAYQTDLVDLRRDEANAAIRFGDDAVQVASIRRSMNKIEEALSAEVERTVQQLNNTAEVRDNVVDALETQLRGLEGTILIRSNEQIRLSQLQRVADANRRVYEDFLGRFKETSEIQNLQRSDADVISYASPPGSPSYPRKQVAVALGGAGGLALGLALAFLMELLPKRLVTTREVTERLALPIFGKLPRVPTKMGRMGSLRNVLRDSSATLTKSARTLRNNVDLNSDLSVGSIVVASDQPGGVKTNVSMLLAWAAAQKGRSCLLVDADTRTASLSRALGHRRTTSLVSVLYGESTLEDSIVTLGALGVSMLPTETVGADPAMIFDSYRAKLVVEEMMREFDVVIFDAPALRHESDAMALPVILDLGLYAVASGRTLARDADRGLEIFRKTKLNDIGAVLTGLKPRDI